LGGLFVSVRMNGIVRIELPVPGVEQLRAEAQAEGYDFIETLVDDWASTANRFDAPGEGLFGLFDEGVLVAVGGVNSDPFARDAQIGRIRRVYVRPAWRNKGVGRALVSALVEEARKSFARVRLRAENADAARLYERLGFVPIENPDATHILVLASGL
jgi:GNAT superfamily N-acetyltransferase